MTFKRFLSEEYFTTIKTNSGTCEVWKNPKSDELRIIKDAAELDNEIRAWVDPKTSNVYMWASSCAEHGDVYTSNKFQEHYIPLYIHLAPLKVFMSHYSVFGYDIYNPKHYKYIEDSIKKNPNLQRLFGHFNFSIA